MTSAARPDTTYATRLTAAAPAAIAVIELSGPSAREFLEQCWRGATELPRCINAIRFGTWMGVKTRAAESSISENVLASEDVVICWTAPDTVEIHCHGGLQAAKRILSDLRLCGAEIRTVHEKISSQQSDPYIAAALIDLEKATTEITASILLDQARGALSQAMVAIRSLVEQDNARPFQPVVESADGANTETKETLGDQAAKFPRSSAPHPPAPSPQKIGERGRSTSRGEIDKHNIARTARVEAIAMIEDLLSRQSYGLHLIQPWRLAIIGPPNAGKSSLLNAILGYDRAIVDSIAGTTRDALNEHTSLCGWPFVIVDTAGLRETNDAIEEKGVERAHRSAKLSDIVLLLVDPIQGWNHQHEEIHKAYRSKCIAVHSKADLGLALPNIPNGLGATSISAQTKIGLEILYEMILNKLIQVLPQPGQAVPFRREHLDQLDRWLRELAPSGK